MYRMPLNYNPEKTTKSTKITKDNDNTRGAVNTSGIENSRGTEKSKASMSSKVIMNSSDNVYSSNFFDTNSGKNYKNQSEKTSSFDFTNLSTKKLQEAIIWSEILGKPVSKREKRR